MRWLEENKDLSFENYEELWEWSVTELEEFWTTIWEYYEVESSEPYSEALGSRRMPGAEWFPGAELNYAEHVLRNARPGEPAIMHQSELRPLGTLTWRELHDRVAALAAGLKSMGVGRGDRVVAARSLPQGNGARISYPKRNQGQLPDRVILGEVRIRERRADPGSRGS